MSEWIKYTEQSPFKSGEYLVAYNHPHRNEICVTSLRWINKSRIKFSEKHIKMGWSHKGAAKDFNVKAWMPLPAPPEEL